MNQPHTYYARQHQSWGNRITILDWPKGRIAGWLRSTPKVGDRIIFDMESGREQATVVTSVDPKLDPPDMFFATIRLEDEPESAPASEANPAASLDDLAAQLEAAGWTIDFRAEGATLRVSRDYPDESFSHRLVVSDRNQLIPATVYLIEEGYGDDGDPVYACGPTLMDETLDALVLFQQYRDVYRAQRSN